ncbi:MAG: Loki-CTERM sorting domain-containing protein, partial [Candidatus Hermodarchaeota archaeon]
KTAQQNQHCCRGNASGPCTAAFNNLSIGDNLHEGVLLSYENSTTIDWQGYSLNGQANRTILGNTTIPMPSDGLHSIQVFGNDSMGTMYESNLRYFTVSTSAPDLTINTPVDSEVFGAISPSYSLSITGLYDTIWYTLDGGASNITASGLTGTIDQTEWDSLGDGIVTIVFYTNNSAGMIGSDVVQVIKSVSVEPPPGIPGYNLVIVLGILCVVTFFIINRRKTKN